MREIKFRGKRIDNNEFVYGSYFQHKKLNLCIATQQEVEKNIQHLIVQDKIACDWNFENGMQGVEVYKHTVGQYTGLKDKNSKEIFEGDIIKSITIDTNATIYAVINFGKYRDVNNDDSEIGFYIEYKGEQISMFNGESEGYNLPNMIEVVGNIYDNPELLGEIK